MFKKFRKWLFSFLTGVDLEIFQRFVKYNETMATVGVQSANSGLNDTYLFDFKNYGSLYRMGQPIVGGGGMAVPDNPGQMMTGTIGRDLHPVGTVLIPNHPPAVMDGQATDSKKESSPKIAIKPIDVLKELETVPTPFNLSNLDDKITVLKDKEKMIVQQYAKREMVALIERLENRKKYMQFKTYFDGFQNTTDEKIEAFIKKHEFVMNTSDIFLPEFPTEAVEVMKSYTEKMNEVCGKKPVFYVIAMQEHFRKVLKDRDPILLVQSPFGFFWQILGAWDKEMLLLGEL